MSKSYTETGFAFHVYFSFCNPISKDLTYQQITRFSVVTLTVVFAYCHKVQQYYRVIVSVIIKLFSKAISFVNSTC